jgi:hypothetical protein
MTLGIIVTLAVGFGREFGYAPGWLPPNLVGLVVAGILVVLVSLGTRTSEREIEVYEEMRQPVGEEEARRPADAH